MVQIDRNFFIAQYREEVADHIQGITQGLFQLEEHPEQSVQILQEIFRIAHTLKGSSRMMGYNQISSLAHKMEDLLAELRDGHLKPSPTITDILFYCLETIDYLVEGLVKDIKRSANLEDFDDLFEAIIAGKEIKVPFSHAMSLKSTLPPPKAPAEKAPLQAAPIEEKEERQYIRIHTRELDNMLTLVGELIINQYRYEGHWALYQNLLQQLKNHQKHFEKLHDQIPAFSEQHKQTHLQELSNKLEGSASDILEKAQVLSKKFKTDGQQMRSSIEKLQEQVIDIRMIPASRIFDLLPRLVRMTTRKLEKTVQVSLEGEHTRIDSRIIEEMRDPLIHLVQNAVHHGIESPEERRHLGKDPCGHVAISAQQEGNRILIKIKDDGQGIQTQHIRKLLLKERKMSRQKVNAFNEQELFEILFQPGFSTSETIDDISGRGFGLDIVRAHVDRIQGEIEVKSEAGEGCEFILKLPLTLTIMDALLVRVADQYFAVPTMAVETSFDLTDKKIEVFDNNPFVSVDASRIPLVELRCILEAFPNPESGKENRSFHFSHGQSPETVIVLRAEDRRIGFVVDDLEEEREIVIKNLGPCLKRVRNVAGATTVRGEVVIILFVRDLVRSADALLEGRDFYTPAFQSASISAAQRDLPDSENTVPRILLIDDSPNTREVERVMLENAGYEVLSAENGQQGWDLLGTQPVDLVVSDIEMPEMDGLELTRRIKEDESLRALPIVIVSTKGEAEDRQQGLEAGASAYIIKGEFDEKSLLNIVDSCLGSVSGSRQQPAAALPHDKHQGNVS
ncbi:hypothetical protein CSB45_06955 [candidate division KSB3 bacterium]|uniref:Chemotaxis protein CheA n=1 Tax=candidate division KSB3 bacterium TaxID=2044937 RepID=A0A2G6E719_9BACT|nr:MAG: hypothetical protein CSB45_06955 [candidate division KSB3 bacterium]PIE30026.1 MAG: hypothetical protein CSA57_05635 [candidate division KSB3 bacterium]